MSYILDALRRADAERERDPARGIHAQPAAVLPDAARTRVPGWAWPMGAALVVVAIAVLSWQRTTPSAPAPSLPVAQPAPAPVVPVAAAVLPAAPPPPVVIERVVRVVPAAAPSMTIKAPPAAPAAVAAAPAAAASATAPADRIYNVLELPADVQSALPKLAITGGVHSDNPAQRMLVVGGQVMHEGAELAPGVVLDQIRPRGAVLKFRGYRYAVTY